MASSAEQNAWSLDQLAKSAFFHQKLHEWGTLEIAYELEEIQGENLNWDALGISQDAWNKIIHRGIKPILVFAHPQVLTSSPRSLAYYRTLAMVSQKSMSRVGFGSIGKFEQGAVLPNDDTALAAARILNDIISRLVEVDDYVDAREFDLWRGMAAGTQAQGSWQNAKGQRVEIEVKRFIRNRLDEAGLIEEESPGGLQIQLTDARRIIFSDEPDIAIFNETAIECAIEIKGGIDTAGVLERIGAAMKSLSRAKEENASSITILVLQEVSLTETARADLQNNQNIVNYWFTLEELSENRERQNVFWDLLGLPNSP